MKFIIRRLGEKLNRKGKDIFIYFVDLQKAFCRVNRKEIGPAVVFYLCIPVRHYKKMQRKDYRLLVRNWQMEKIAVQELLLADDMVLIADIGEIFP